MYSFTTNYKLKQIADNIGLDDVWIGFKSDLETIFNKGDGKGNIPLNYIINTDKSSGMGIHWVAVFVEDDDVYYFNSLNNRSRDFDALEEVRSTFKGYNIYINQRQIQSDVSGWCGIFVLYFLYFMNRKNNNKRVLFQQFQAIWNRNPSKNLPLLKQNFKLVGDDRYYYK